jgi:hypothetical protein
MSRHSITESGGTAAQRIESGIMTRRPIITRYRATRPRSQLSCAAYHEAGHGVATLLGFRTVRSPMLPPPVPVELMEVFTSENPHPYLRIEGKCYGPSTYAPEWPKRRIANEWREAMEWHILIMQAGGIAEAIYRGERRKRDVLYFAILNCGCRSDHEQVTKTLADLRALTRRPQSEQRFAERTRALLLRNWSAVRALAEALTEAKRLEGEQVEAIIAPYLAPLTHVGTKPSKNSSLLSGSKRSRSLQRFREI